MEISPVLYSGSYICKRRKTKEDDLDQDLKKCIISYYQLTERNLAVKLKVRPFSIFIIVVYARSAQCTEEKSQSR